MGLHTIASGAESMGECENLVRTHQCPCKPLQWMLLIGVPQDLAVIFSQLIIYLSSAHNAPWYLGFIPLEKVQNVGLWLLWNLCMCPNTHSTSQMKHETFCSLAIVMLDSRDTWGIIVWFSWGWCKWKFTQMKYQGHTKETINTTEVNKNTEVNKRVCWGYLQDHG